MKNTCSVEIEKLEVEAYTVPTDSPESDGTLGWHSTGMVVVHAAAGGKRGIGYTYASAAAATLIVEDLRQVAVGRNAMAVTDAWYAMVRAVRNNGRPGICSMAISAVDCALWDLKARLLDLPLAVLLGSVRQSAPVYGSGGFTSYDDARLAGQLGGWVDEGISMVKMKVGRDPGTDPHRVAIARKAVGDGTELFVDANGGYSRKQALAMADLFAGEYRVTWFEEPCSSDDLEGLRILRDRCPPGLEIAAGEYGFDLVYFKRMLEAGAVDCLQADVTRCGGITGFAQVVHLCEAFQIPLSTHCAPAEHLHPVCAAAPVRHMEYFHDHVRIEEMLFDGIPRPIRGALQPDPDKPGNGLQLKTGEAGKYRV